MTEWVENFLLVVGGGNAAFLLVWLDRRRERRRVPVGVAGHPDGRHLHYVRGWVPGRPRYEHAVDVCWCRPTASVR